MPTKKPIRLAVVGGRRGRAFNNALKAFQDRIVLSAVCDLSPEVVAKWKEEFPGIRGFTSYEEMIERADCDGVFVATPMGLHAEQSIKAMQAGKHVVSEVIAATTLDECWRLIEAVEKTGLTYMLSENYCYMRPNMMVLNMVKKGVFGELTYAEGAYIHDCRDIMFYPDGSHTWRGEYGRTTNCNTYPTHSLGPVAQWLGINKEDRMVSTTTWMSKEAATSYYAARRFGKDHPGAKKGFYAHGDSAVTLIHTEKGALIVLRFDAVSARPHNMTHYVLQGTEASYVSARHGKEDPLIWIDGRSPGTSPPDAQWEPLWKYAEEHEHPRWKKWGEEARKAGHGGGDFFILEDFTDAILNNKRPAIDVYDAVAWSSIMPLSMESVKKGGVPVDVPDFAKRRAR